MQTGIGTAMEIAFRDFRPLKTAGHVRQGNRAQRWALIGAGTAPPRTAGLGVEVRDPDEDRLARGLRRLAHIDDSRQIRFLLDHLDGEHELQPAEETAVRR